MKDLIGNIIEKNFTSAENIFKESIQDLVKQKLHEKKKMLAAALSEGKLSDRATEYEERTGKKPTNSDIKDFEPATSKKVPVKDSNKKTVREETLNEISVKKMIGAYRARKADSDYLYGSKDAGKKAANTLRIISKKHGRKAAENAIRGADLDHAGLRPGHEPGWDELKIKERSVMSNILPKGKMSKAGTKANKKQQGELKSYYKMQQPAKGKKRWTGSYGQLPSPLPLPEEKDDSPFKGGDTEKVSNPKAKKKNQAYKLAVQAMKDVKAKQLKVSASIKEAKSNKSEREGRAWAASDPRHDPEAETRSAQNAQFRKDKAEAAKKRAAEKRKKKSLTEVSAGLVKSYIKKSREDAVELGSKLGAQRKKGEFHPFDSKYDSTLDKKIFDRKKGRILATAKLKGKAKVPTKG